LAASCDGEQDRFVPEGVEGSDSSCKFNSEWENPLGTIGASSSSSLARRPAVCAGATEDGFEGTDADALEADDPFKAEGFLEPNAAKKDAECGAKKNCVST
jgi:hypothetical protein